jgi:foldase protein PrsA
VKKPLVLLCLGLTVLAPVVGGCRSRNGGAGVDNGSGGSALPPPVKPGPGTVATFHSEQITMEELQRPLIEAYGLNVMLNLVQLHAAEASAKRRNITITEADVQAEKDRTYLELARQGSTKQISDMEIAEEKGDKATAEKLRKEVLADGETLLDQFLTQKRLTRPEFDISMRTNAYLRKLMEPTVEGAITDKMIDDAYRFRYGEKVQVAHIQCQNMQEIAEVRKRLARQEDFRTVAMALSRNVRTGPLGGELPPFSRQQTIVSQVFVDTAFALKEGEVSEPVNTGGAFHLIKLLKRIEPKVVKKEDVAESLRRDLHAAMLAQGMQQARADLFQSALASLKVTDPTLKAQFERWNDEGKARRGGREEALRKMDDARDAAEAASATQPGTQPATAPTTDPAPPAPPATQPAPVPPTAPAGQ